MPPLAGKPPYATDEPDSFYESPKHPQRRQRQPPPPDPNDRTSNYDVYDNYFGNDTTSNRQSGAGAVGLGFLNGSVDEEDSDDDDYKASASSKQNQADNPFSSKHKVLAAATAARTRTSSPPPQYIAAPKPGYAAPIAALNLAKPEQVHTPSSHGSQRRANNNGNFNNLQVSTNRPGQRPSPAPSSPHPLHPPVSPITPAFARPRPPKAGGDVTFAPEKGPIMRGDAEHTTLPKRGEAGDDFWRRFSMVAREDRGSGPKQSAWLRKTQSGSNRLATWVWLVGLVLALCAAGGIGIGWYLSHKAPDHQLPTAIGGSAGEAAPSNASTSLKPVGSGNPSIKSSFHVSPTHTVQRRVASPAQITALAREEHRRVAWRH